MYIKRDIKYSVLPNITLHSSIENLWISIKCNGVRYVIGSLYRPPDGTISFLKDLELILSHMHSEADHVMFLGDLNVNLLNGDDKILLPLLESLGFSQIINEPTRITSSSSSLVDVICVSKDIKVSEFGVQDMDNISDHRLIHCKVDLKMYKLPAVSYFIRDYSLFSLDEFNFDANSVNWTYVEQLQDLDQKLEFLNKAIKTIFDIHAPVKLVVNKNRIHRPYITETIKQMIKIKK